MIPHNAPHELKALDNWIPLDGKAPLSGSKVWSMAANRWGFGDLTVAIHNGMRATGMAYCIMSSDPFTVFDLDDPYKMKADAEGVMQYVIPTVEERLACEATQMRILSRFETAYWERSNSDKGWHGIIRGELPQSASRVTTAPGIEIYSCGQYVWVTGKTPKSTYNLDGHQEQLNGLAHAIWQAHGRNTVRAEASELVVIDDGIRAVGVSDEEGIRLLGQRNKINIQILEGGKGYGPSWSHDTAMLIGELDKVLGDPDQIKRILMMSPRLRNAGVTDSKENRYERTERRFATELTNCRLDERQVAFIKRRKALPKFDPDYVPPPPLTKQQQREAAKESLKQAMEALAKGDDK